MGSASPTASTSAVVFIPRVGATVPVDGVVSSDSEISASKAANMIGVTDRSS